ncbi:MAG: hypothetical protein RIS43_945 [Actinomycetota bacterium]|jgi:hypothetical protein
MQVRRGLVGCACYMTFAYVVFRLVVVSDLRVL